VSQVRISNSLDGIAARGGVGTMGTFDGVHLGHRYLLQEAKARSEELGVPLLAITFEPAPAQVLRPETFCGRLSTPADKRSLIAAAGVDEILELSFTREFSRTSATDFLEALERATDLRELWVGEEFAFGRDREGSIEGIRDTAARLGLTFRAVTRIEHGGDVVSSSRIRKHLCAGEIRQANEMLGRRFAIGGIVEEGAKIGRTIGFPTANVAPPEHLAPMADGIYAVFAQLGDAGNLLPAMTYIGTRPALNTGARMIETHILDFDADIYGERLITHFVERVRPDSDFPDVATLVAQMQRDEATSRGILRDATHKVA